MLGGALLSYTRGLADAGEIAFVVSALGMLDGYLRQIGNHVRSLQKAVNDAEEMVELMAVPAEREIVRTPAAPLPARAAALSFDQGRIVEDGTPAALMAREDGLYRALRARQTLAA